MVGWSEAQLHKVPYHFGHSTISMPTETAAAVVEHASAGFVLSNAASLLVKGGNGRKYAPNLANRYFRHEVPCKECRIVVKSLKA